MEPHTVAVLGTMPSDDLVRRLAEAGPVECYTAIDPVGALDPRRRWPSPPSATAVIQLAGHHADTVQATISPEHLLGLLLVDRRELRRDRDTPEPGIRGGLTQISFVGARADADFAHRYANHIDIVRAEHPGVAHYRQDTVVDRLTSDARLTHTAAVSQLWFATDQDFANRYYASNASPSIVRNDIETFLDLDTTWSVLTREWPR